jgi:DNA helicase TIP49 (TBP-interacting protein)
MKVKIHEVIKNYKGKPYGFIEDGKRVEMTVRDALNEAINGYEVVGDRQVPLTSEEKGRIYQLSTKLWSATQEVDFTPEEIVFIKERAGKVVNVDPLVNGRIGELFEEKVKKEAK